MRGHEPLALRLPWARRFREFFARLSIPIGRRVSDLHEAMLACLSADNYGKIWTASCAHPMLTTACSILGEWNAVIPRADVAIDPNPSETRRVVDSGIPERFDRRELDSGDVHSPDL